MVSQARPRVIVFNGGSSSGKSSLTRALQQVLPGSWLRFGVDTLVDACPPSLLSRERLDLADDGTVHVAPAFTSIEGYWMAGLGRMAELGAQLLIEDDFVSGPSAQQRWRVALAGVPAGWVGVRCEPAIAAEREHQRGDRTTGMADQQAEAVHLGIDYDLEVDSTRKPPDVLAREVLLRWFS